VKPTLHRCNPVNKNTNTKANKKGEPTRGSPKIKPYINISKTNVYTIRLVCVNSLLSALFYISVI